MIDSKPFVKALETVVTPVYELNEFPHEGKGQVCLPQERGVAELGKRYQRVAARAARLSQTSAIASSGVLSLVMRTRCCRRQHN